MIGIAVLEPGVRENCIADWLFVESEAKIAADTIAQRQCLSPEETLELLAMENVRVQLNHLKNLR